MTRRGFSRPFCFSTPTALRLSGTTLAFASYRFATRDSQRKLM